MLLPRLLLVFVSTMMFFIAVAAYSAVADDLNTVKDHKIWLDEFKKEASKQGISSEIFDKAFADFKPIAAIIALDRKQPEGTKTLSEYLEIMVNEQRVSEGRDKLAEYSEILKKIEAQYGVDREIIIALWGIETSYGENSGNYPVVDALATLAYEGRRSDFFRNELINALLMLEKKDIELEEMSGSWAGAMGQCQFMPSTYINYAVDYDGDGKRDIWNNTSDALASIANYLRAEGWKENGEIAMPVTLPEKFDLKLADINKQKPTHAWRKLGVTYSDGSALVENSLPSSIIMVGRAEDAVPYIVYDNYKVILKWNRSRYFATAVDLLAEEIRAP